MNKFDNLPVELYDVIIQYNNILDIIKFKNTSKENYKIINNIIKNKLSKISLIYKINKDLCNINTWIKLEKTDYNIKYIKQYYEIYKNISYNKKLSFVDIKNIFFNLSNFIKLIYLYDKNKINHEKYKYIIFTIFIFIKNSNHIFLSKVYDDHIMKSYYLKTKMLNVILRLYNLKLINILTLDDIFKLENIILDLFKELIDNLKNIRDEDLEDIFIVDYLKSLFIYKYENIFFINSKYIRDILKEYLYKSNLKSIFF